MATQQNIDWAELAEAERRREAAMPKRTVSLKGVIFFLQFLRNIHQDNRYYAKISNGKLIDRLVEKEKDGFEELGGARLPLHAWCLHRAAFFAVLKKTADHLDAFINYVTHLKDILEMTDMPSNSVTPPPELHYIKDGREERHPSTILAPHGVVMERKSFAVEDKRDGELKFGEVYIVGDQDVFMENILQRDRYNFAITNFDMDAPYPK